MSMMPLLSLKHWWLRWIRWCAQTCTGRKAVEKGWSTKWRARSRWIVVSTAWPTAACRQSVTRTTTVLLTRRASSTLTTLRSSPTRPTLSTTAPGAGGARPSLYSSKPTKNVTCTAKRRTFYYKPDCIHAVIARLLFLPHHLVWRCISTKNWYDILLCTLLQWLKRLLVVIRQSKSGQS